MLTSKRLTAALAGSAFVLIVTIANAAIASAQPYGGVASVSVANGNVVILRADSGTQVAGALNATLLPGDTIATGGGSRAEVQFNGVSVLRLAQNTQVRFINLNPGSREMLLAGGTVDLSELQGSNGGPQVDTPPLAVRPNQPGDYRVSVLGNGQTLVTVRRGAATISSNAGSRTISPGSTLVAYGSYSNPTIVTQAPVAYDAFDQFVQARDQSIVTAYNQNSYLSPELAGYSNFANYGQWQNVPGYGESWAPNNQAQNNFAPYQNGQWVYQPNYGYTWVANEPWGYAPTHYGTWYNNPQYGGWLWQPPAYQNQSSASALSSAWLPALVAFFMSGNGGVNSLFGNASNPYGNADIGWIPLAPGEQYQPWYGYGQSGGYPPSTVTNVTNIYNYYGNARYLGGATIVPVSAWRSGNFTRRIRLQPKQLQRVVLVRGAIPVVPTAANLRYTTTIVKRPIVISKAFTTNARFAAKVHTTTRLSFAAQQAQFKRIVSVKPKVVSIAPRVKTAPPVYQPKPQAPVRLPAVVKPPVHPVAAPKPLAKPIEPKPIAKPIAPKPVAPKPVAPKPIAPKPVTPQVVAPKPIVHPIVRPVAPKPIAPAVVAPKPVVHPVAPQPVAPKPIVHPVAPKPVVHPAAAPKPVAHPVRVPKPPPHPAPAPKAAPAHQPKPAAHPSDHP